MNNEHILKIDDFRTYSERRFAIKGFLCGFFGRENSKEIKIRKIDGGYIYDIVRFSFAAEKSLYIVKTNWNGDKINTITRFHLEYMDIKHIEYNEVTKMLIFNNAIAINLNPS